MASIEKRPARPVKPGQKRKQQPKLWRVRYRDPEGRQRSRSFGRYEDARLFRVGLEADLQNQNYVDPDAGKVLFKTYAAGWLERQTFNESTRDAVQRRLTVHVDPFLGKRPLRAITPDLIQAWIRWMQANDSGHALAPSTIRTIKSNVASIFGAAVDSGLIRSNPATARSVKTPEVVRERVEPWTPEIIAAVAAAMPERYRALVVVTAALGLRQGEAFALTVDDIEFLGNDPVVRVRSQVKMLKGAIYVDAPKRGKSRTVPLPATAREALAAHLAKYPARPIPVPIAAPDGPVESRRLVFTTRESKPLNKNYFNVAVWKPALVAAAASLKEAGVLGVSGRVLQGPGDQPGGVLGVSGGVPERALEPNRRNGMHILRHSYASLLLDGGVSIRAVAEYLGHSDPGFTLRVYGHLMPASGERTRNAVDLALRGGAVDGVPSSSVPGVSRALA